MKNDATSLDNLQDIVELPPVSWWPLATGWWVVIGLIVLLAGYQGFKAWRRWQQNAYRREALHDLGAATSVVEIAELLKRVAICGYSRTATASLTGKAWCDWLGETGDGKVSEVVANCLTSGIFEKTTSSSLDELRTFAGQWIRTHRAVASAARQSNEESEVRPGVDREEIVPC